MVAAWDKRCALYVISKPLPIPILVICSGAQGISVITSRSRLFKTSAHRLMLSLPIFDSIGFSGTGTSCKTHKLHESGKGGGRLEGIPTNPADEGVDLVAESSKPDLALLNCN